MATPVELPQFGTTVEECVITRWVKQKGDAVAAGDLVAEIETDKTTFEVIAPVGGTLLETFFAEGAVVPVFTKICVIGSDGEVVDRFRPDASASARPEIPASYGETSPKRPRSQSREGGPVAPSTRAPWRPRARNFNQQRTAPLGARATIARRMCESLATTAQYTLHSSANAAGLVAVRTQAKADATTAEITIGDLVAHCTVQALLEIPALNAEFIDGRFNPHTAVHLGFACDTDRGLLVPVVHHAHELSLRDLSVRMKALGKRAVDGTISPDDLRGGTFTISNLGSLGIEGFTPIINPPQVAILGIGAIQPRPVRVAAAIEFVDTIALSLTCDHQAVDGAPGARFLRRLREKIETVGPDVLRS
jgi:pyruvate dehydrogenase E2 component (dihydrolipoamide acetyltransferase)